MRFPNKILRIFSSMSRREKTLVVLLTAVFVLSAVKFAILNIHFALQQEKGIFSEGMVGRIKSLNPLLTDFNDTDRDISELIFSGLIKYDPPAKNFFPDLAASWERSGNGLTYTFNLRPNILWHDGQPITADDVLFTFQSIVQDPAFRNPILKNAFEGIKIQKKSPTTISFVLPKPNSYFISNLTAGLVPKHILENTSIANLDKAQFNRHPIGSGPYKFVSLDLDPINGDRIDLEAFQNYYGNNKPTIERIRFYAFPDETLLLKQRSALNAISKLSPTGEKALKTDAGFNNYKYTLNQFTALYFNTENPLLKDKKIRQALNLAINKNALVQENEKRIDALDLEEHSQEPSFAYSLEEAKKILDSAGMIMGTTTQFRTDNKGGIATLNLVAFSKMPKELAEKIKQHWEAVGIQTNTKFAETDEFFDLVNARQYDVLLVKQNLGYNRDFYPILHSSQALEDSGTPSGLNFANFKSFSTDGLTEAIRKEKDPKAKEKLLKELSKILASEIPLVFISTPVYSYWLDKTVPPFRAGNLDFHCNRLTILTSLPLTP